MSTISLPGVEITPLRERNKRKRRKAILDAALELLRDGEPAGITTDLIADRAEVSPATVYNLVGTREDLLLALVDRVVETVRLRIAQDAQANADDPVATARLVVDESTAAFVADSAAYRRIVGSIRNFTSAQSSLSFDPSELQVTAMTRAQQHGIIRDDLDAVALGRQIYLSYNGAMFRWSAGMLSDAGLIAAARHGLFVVLAAAATDPFRMRFLDKLHVLEPQLADSGWSP